MITIEIDFLVDMRGSLKLEREKAHDRKREIIHEIARLDVLIVDLDERLIQLGDTRGEDE